MKLTLEGCKHIRFLRSTRGRDGRQHVTCASCYQRLVSAVSDEDDSFAYQATTTAWLPDAPAAVCEHAHRQGIQILNIRQNYHDAICTDCGVVLRHPDGPGEWVEVLFNGFLIAEPP